MDAYDDLLHTARACADECAKCAAESRHEAFEGDAEMESCAAECARCEDALRACVHDLGRGSMAGAKIAADACDVCAEECEQHAHAHCKTCAESCRKTAESLRFAAASA